MARPLWMLVVPGNDDYDQDDCDGGFVDCDEIELLTFRHRQRRSFGQDTRWKRMS